MGGMTDLYRSGLDDAIRGAGAQHPEQPYYMQGFNEGEQRRRTFLHLRVSGKGFYDAAAMAHLTHEQAEGVRCSS
jgi:hypothetical protein